MKEAIAAKLNAKKEVIIHYLTVFSGNGIGRGLSFVTSLVLARALGAAGFGIFSIFFTVMLLVWQLPAIIDVTYVRYAKAGKAADPSVYLKSAFVMKATVCLILLFLAFPAGWCLSQWVFKKPELTMYVACAIASGVSLSVFSTLAAIYQAESRFFMFSAVNIFFYSVIFLSVGFMSVSGISYTYRDVVYVYVFFAVLTGILGLAYLSKKIMPVLPVKRSMLKEMGHFGKWLFAEQLLYILLQRMDLLFLVRLASYEEVGIYSAAVRVAMLASLLTSAVSSVFMPRGCASLHSKGHLRSYLKESLSVSALLAIAIAVLAGLVPFLTRLLFGEQYMPSVNASKILLVEAVFVLFYTPFSYLFYASGNTKQIFKLGVARLLIAVAGLLLFIPRFGPAGAALSLAVSSACAFLMVVAMTYRIIINAHKKTIEP